MKGLAVAAILIAALVDSAFADLQAGFALFERGDYAAAQRQLQPLAEQGDPTAQYALGIIYLNEFVEPPTPDAAAIWIRKAAEQGYLLAQTELARMYRTGDGVSQDFSEMVKWYCKAAEQGDVGAQLLMADSYAYGYGVEPDHVRAYMWYEIAIRYWGPLAVRARDMIAAKMTSEQVAEAVMLAGDWFREKGQ